MCMGHTRLPWRENGWVFCYTNPLAPGQPSSWFIYPSVPYKYRHCVHIPCRVKSCKTLNYKTIVKNKQKATIPRTVRGTYWALYTVVIVIIISHAGAWGNVSPGTDSPVFLAKSRPPFSPITVHLLLAPHWLPSPEIMPCSTNVNNYL